MKKINIKKIIRVQFFCACIFLAGISAVELWYWNVGVGWTDGFFGFQTLITVSILYCLLYIFFAKMYHALSIGKYRMTDLVFSQALSFGFTDAIMFVSSFFWFHNFRRIHITYFFAAFVLQIFVAMVLVYVCNRWNAVHDGPRKIVIIYGDEQYRGLIKKMGAYENRYKIIACIHEQDNRIAIQKAIDEAEDIYVFEVKRDIRNHIIRFCRRTEKQVHVSMDVDDVILLGFGASHFFDTPFFNSSQNDPQWYFPYIKRLADIMISSTLLIIMFPVFLVTAIAIKAEDGGSIIYSQKRLTKDGRIFTIYKFRSMKPDSEKKAVLASKNDTRITKVGKFIRFCRIDELPQLLNVLKGDMSLVGPRPERPEIARKYERDFPDFSMRLEVKAGLTGYAQIYGKYNSSPKDKLKMDLLYITHQSILLDLKILFYTIKILFKVESTEGI